MTYDNYTEKELMAEDEHDRQPSHQCQCEGPGICPGVLVCPFAEECDEDF